MGRLVIEIMIGAVSKIKIMRIEDVEREVPSRGGVLVLEPRNGMLVVKE